MIGLIRPFALASLMFLITACPVITVANESNPQLLTGTLNFEVEYDRILTSMRYYSDGQHLRVELGEPGDPYLIWIRGLEGIDGIAALNPLVKNYSIEVDAPPMWDWLNNDGSIDKRRKPKELKLPPGTVTEYMGFQCTQYELDTDGPDTTILMLDNALPLPYLLTRLWKNLADASRHMQLLSKEHNGIPLRIERKKWSSRAFFSLQLVSHDPKLPDPSIFKIPEDYYQVAAQIRGSRRDEKKLPGGQTRP